LNKILNLRDNERNLEGRINFKYLKTYFATIPSNKILVD
jgi:hypothetical protein